MSNIQTSTNSRSGFTIVELLIVIVVIGILAAITIVAYSGITARANTTKAQTNAETIMKVAEAYNADNAGSGTTGYPTTQALLITYGASAASVAKIPSAITWGTPASTPATAQAYILYAPGTTGSGVNGGCISWWNYTTNAVNYTSVGNGVVTGGGTACSAA